MNPTLKSQINLIFRGYKTWWNEPPNDPATPESITKVANWFSNRYHQQIPTQIVEFWRTTNGIDLNGKSIWATERRDRMRGILDMNELYADDTVKHCFIGSSDDVYTYSYTPELAKYHARATGDFDDFDEEYETFDDLATAVLQHAIDSVGLKL